MGLKISTYDSLNNIPDEKIRNGASSLDLSEDLEEQTGSYNLGGYPLLYSIDLINKTIMLEYLTKNAISDTQNPTAQFSLGSGASYSSYSVVGDFPSRRMILNGTTCRKVHPGVP